MPIDTTCGVSRESAVETRSGVLLSFAEIISALSFAIDLTEGTVPGHAVRSCVLGMRIALELELPGAQLSALYHALLLDRGAEIALKLGLSTETADAIRRLDEHWDGSGSPDQMRGEQIPLLARILAVAQHLDVFACEHDPHVALQLVCERSGTWFDPALVGVVLMLEREGTLWTDTLPSEDTEATRQLALSLQPDAANGIHAEEIDRICEAFAHVVDAKSPFTYRHSMGVAEVAGEIADALELSHERRQMVRRAALLHDLGKLAVSNTILDKADKLSAEEWAVVVEHPRLTREILARIKPFAELAVIAGAHHERVDGTGYPDRLKGDEICLEARVVAVADFYAALTENRPYRRGISHDEAMSILRQQALDGGCVDALERSRGKDQPFPLGRLSVDAPLGLAMAARSQASPSLRPLALDRSG